MLHRELLIGGQFFGGPCDQGIAKAPIRAPYSGHVVGTVAEAGWPEMDAALDAARRAFDTWRHSPRRERAALLRRVAAAVRDRAEELVETLTLEVGKPVKWSRAEVARCALTFDLAADLLAGPSGQVLPADYDPRGDRATIRVERFPVGVVLAITPYNWPYNLAAHKVAPALAAGCTVVLKSSPLSPLSTLSLARLIHECGCPDGVLNAVNADVAETKRAVVDPRVDLVSFTGSEAVGFSILAAAPEKRVVLELGGDASAIVCPDADPDRAVEALALSAYGYAGQVCISAQHALVHESVYERFVSRMTSAALACPVGDPMDEATVCGPVVNDEAAERIVEVVEEAVAGGAQVLAGGTRERNRVAPTLVAGVPRGCRLAEDEVFGPVLTVAPYQSLDEAIERVNSSRFGLQSSVFTRDLGTVEECYRRLEVGSVVANDAPSLRFDTMPYGGTKRSGRGREGLAEAMLAYTEPRVLVTRWSPGV